jgi:CHAT domain-containing protein
VLTDSPSIVMVGNPDFRNVLERLPETEQECKELEKWLKKLVPTLTCKTLLEMEATKVALLNDIESCTILHIATHGSDERLNNELPGYVCLAITQSDTIDDRRCHLSSDDILKLDLRKMKLVFLDCCLTGVGRPSINGLFGLGRAFLLAGAKVAVLTRSRIPDTKETVKFVCKFYEYYMKKNGEECGKADLALNSAQAFAIENRISRETWASYFVLRAV